MRKTQYRCLQLAIAAWLSATPAGAHNAACWGRGRDDAMRPDIVCPSLTEAFVTRLKGVSRAQVLAAMNGPGVSRGNPNLLHFTSNHDYGRSGYRGEINVLFQNDTVVEITTLAETETIDPDYEYIWIDGEGECSDYPASPLSKCRGPDATDATIKLTKDLAAMLGH